MVREHLDWPFFEPRQRALEKELEAWAAAHVRDVHGGAADGIDTRAICLLRERWPATTGWRARQLLKGMS